MLLSQAKKKIQDCRIHSLHMSCSSSNYEKAFFVLAVALEAELFVWHDCMKLQLQCSTASCPSACPKNRQVVIFTQHLGSEIFSLQHVVNHLKFAQYPDWFFHPDFVFHFVFSWPDWWGRKKMCSMLLSNILRNIETRVSLRWQRVVQYIGVKLVLYSCQAGSKVEGRRRVSCARCTRSEDTWSPALGNNGLAVVWLCNPIMQVRYL